MSLLYANIANLGNLIFMGNLFKYKNTKTFYTHGLLTTGILKYCIYSIVIVVTGQSESYIEVLIIRG